MKEGGEQVAESNEMVRVEVPLGDRSYPILVGPGILSRPSLLLPYMRGQRVLVVSNQTVAPLYLDALKASLPDLRFDEIVLPDGEQYKTLETVNTIYDKLLSGRHERNTTLIALGGGVIGDITGFAAATYLRGVNFIQIPTTLLAQVDSSVGGKTGVNHPLGKNMIGAFHQPQCVLADTEVLNTLDRRELRAGLAEVIKYGLIGNPGFFAWLEDNIQNLLDKEAAALSHAIKVSCEEKARVVAADETESGVRALLNLGHTFGHAIETAMGYGNWLHGEAVAAGMVMAADLSWRMGWIDDAAAGRTRALIEAAGLSACPPAAVSPETFMDLMASDKKVQDGKIRFVLLRGIGEAVIESAVDRELLLETLGAGEVLCRSHRT